MDKKNIEKLFNHMQSQVTVHYSLLISRSTASIEPLLLILEKLKVIFGALNNDNEVNTELYIEGLQ